MSGRKLFLISTVIAAILLGIAFLLVILNVLLTEKDEDEDNNRTTQEQTIKLDGKEIVIPSSWEIVDEYEVSADAVDIYFCYDDSVMEFITINCDAKILSPRDESLKDFKVALSSPGVHSWAGGSTPLVPLEETFEFLGKETTQGLGYEISEDTINEEDSEKWEASDIPHSYYFCNADHICFGADFRQLNYDQARKADQAVRELWSQIRYK